MENSKGRSWCFTTNNWNEEDYADATDLYETFNATYLVVGFETGEEENTPHLQCFVHFKEPVTFMTMKKRLPKSHIEKMLSTHLDATNYCKKDGIYIEFGIFPVQGAITLERLTEVMANPYQNFHLYNQYRRAWNDLQGRRPRMIERRMMYIDRSNVNLLPLHDTFDARQYAPAYVPYYDGESIVVIDIDQYGSNYIDMWIRGTPIRYVYGYQTKYFDPAQIILACAMEDLSIEEATVLADLNEYKI